MNSWQEAEEMIRQRFLPAVLVDPRPTYMDHFMERLQATVKQGPQEKSNVSKKIVTRRVFPEENRLAAVNAGIRRGISPDLAVAFFTVMFGLYVQWRSTFWYRLFDSEERELYWFHKKIGRAGVLLATKHWDDALLIMWGNEVYSLLASASESAREFGGLCSQIGRHDPFAAKSRKGRT